MADPQDMIVPLLREMRAEIAAGRVEAGGRFDLIDARLKSLEEHNRAVQNAQTAETLFGKLVTGEFEGRIEALERKVRELEGPK